MAQYKKRLTQEQCRYLEAAGFDIPFDFTTVIDGRPLYDPLNSDDLVDLLPEKVLFEGKWWYLNIERGISNNGTDEDEDPAIMWAASYWTASWDDHRWRALGHSMVDVLYALALELRRNQLM